MTHLASISRRPADSLSIAVLLTCHNRRETTLACLAHLMSAVARAPVTAAIYLVDDGSTDGTGAAVRAAYPDIHVIQGTGSLYWRGGMQQAWDTAARHTPDAYLWLNDDVLLSEQAVTRLTTVLKAQRRSEGHGGIVVGATRDARLGVTTYGGFVAGRLVDPAESPRRITAFNGNIVLVSAATWQRIGGLSPLFSHAMADIEYGYRARRHGIPVELAPGYLGTCSTNPAPPWLDRSVPLRHRLHALHAPTGCPPDELARLMITEGKWWFPMSIVSLYLRVLLPPRRGIVRGRP